MRADLNRLAYRLGRLSGRWFVARWRWWLALIAPLILICQPAEAYPRVVLGAPVAVETAHPITCAHTRLDGEVTDRAIFQTAKMAREMGAPTIVDIFLWAYMEPREGVYDWSHPERIITLAENQGLHVIARLGFVPAWARPDPSVQPTSLNYLTPDYFDEYARFVAAFAAHFRGRVRSIIPWNEPNLAFEWGYQPVDPAGYVAMLKAVHPAAHAANPDIQILGGALAPTLEKTSNALDDIAYLEAMYQAGAAPYFDALAVHTYGFTLPALDAPAPDRLNFRRAELLLAVMAAHGDSAKPVYITEAGWNDHPRWIHAVRPGQRVQYTLEALQYVETNWPQVKSLCFWYFRAPTLYRTYQDYFGFVTVDFRPRPIYQEVQHWARGWP